MTTRITKAMLETEVQHLNETLKEIGSDVSFEIGFRYGYTAIDELRNGRNYSCYLSGTKTECFYAMQHMRRGLNLALRGF